jgi:hypothetical protein
MARTAGRADRTVIGPFCTGASSVTFAQPVRATCRTPLTRPTGHIQGTNKGQPICGSDRVNTTLHAPYQRETRRQVDHHCRYVRAD